MFVYPSSLAVVMMVCAVGSPGLALFAFYAAVFHSSEPVSLAMGICGVAFFGFSALSLRASRWFRGKVAVDEKGILYTSWRGEESFIRWGDVSRLETRETGQRLGLFDNSQTKAIWIEYQLQNFSNFREYILAHVPPQVRNAGAEIKEFHRSWINKIGLSVVTLAWLFGAKLASENPSARGMQGLVLMCLLFFVLCLILVVMDPIRALITDRALVIEYPGWRRAIPWSSITKVAIDDVNDRGNTWAAVIVARKRGRPIQFFRFREGSLPLRNALQSAWENAPLDEDRSRQS